MTTEIFQGKDEKFYFRFKSDEKQILRSEGYNSKSSAQNGIDSVKRNIANRADDAVNPKENNGGKHFFNVVATNGQTVATSVPFNDIAEMNSAIDYLKKNC